MAREPDSAFDAESAPLIAHELRAPLTVIRGYLEMLHRPLDDESRERALGSAWRAVERLDVLLDDLIATSAEEDVFAPRTLEPISLRDLSEQVIAELVPLYDHSGEVTGDTGVAECDERLMRQALVNLISNALKHTPASGRVQIDIRETDSAVIVRVMDDGPGVPEESRERVFELFERIGAPRMRTDGLGLGLPVTRSIVEQHGGSVRLVEDCGNAGACFEVIVPATQPRED